MDLDVGVLRATEDAVDAFARLDELVASTAPFQTLLMLRSAQAIVAANERPSGAASDDRIPDGAAAFAALLGWWYAPMSREFIAEDPVMCGTALSLDAASEMVRSGRALTLGLLDDAVGAAGIALGSLPYAFDAVLRASEAGGWPPLLLCAALSSNDCGQCRGIAASIARSVAPLAGGLTADAFVVPSCTESLASGLHALARNARDIRRRVQTYRERAVSAAEQCGAFGRGGASARALVELLTSKPAVTVGVAANALALTAPTAGAAVDRLFDAGLLREITGRGRDRVFVYTPAVALAG